MSLVADPAWHAQVRDEGLVVYAGADLAYLIPDLPRATAVALAGLFEPVLRGVARTVDENRLGEPVRQHLAQLRTLGALRPAGLPTEHATPMGVGTRVVGEAPAGLVEMLPHNENPEFLLVVRTTGTLLDLVEVARETKVPHLLLDLAYHHTVALGPFVVPGAGACLACLAVRTGRRWGDPPSPPHPKALAQPEFPLSLARQAIENIRTGSLALLDAVVTVNLDDFTTTRESVLPAADCEICPKVEFGRVSLPWGNSECGTARS